MGVSTYALFPRLRVFFSLKVCHLVFFFAFTLNCLKGPLFNGNYIISTLYQPGFRVQRPKFQELLLNLEVRKKSLKDFCPNFVVDK